MHQNNVLYVIIGILWIKVLSMNHIFTVFVNVSIEENDYRTHFWYMSKDDAINIMNNFNFNEETGSF